MVRPSSIASRGITSNTSPTSSGSRADVRFIEQQYAGIGSQRTGDRNTLLLPARKMARQCVGAMTEHHDDFTEANSQVESIKHWLLAVLFAQVAYLHRCALPGKFRVALCVIRPAVRGSACGRIALAKRVGSERLGPRRRSRAWRCLLRHNGTAPLARLALSPPPQRHGATATNARNLRTRDDRDRARLPRSTGSRQPPLSESGTSARMRRRSRRSRTSMTRTACCATSVIDGDHRGQR